jgi:DnaK suppressor protein
MDPDRARELLAAERARIERALAQLGPEDSGEMEIADLGNLASNTLDNELNEGIADDLRDELSAIERAEARLADGTYGISVVSGKPIPDERLEAVPAADRLVDEERG